MKRYLLLPALLATSAPVLTQTALTQTWSMVAAARSAYGLAGLPDGRSFATIELDFDDEHLVALDPNGAVLWSREVHADLLLYPEVFVDAAGTVWLHGLSDYVPGAASAERVDTDGNRLEFLSLSVDSDSGWIQDMLDTADGGLACAGRIWHASPGGYGGAALRFEQDGSLDWARHVRRADGTRVVFHSVAEMGNGSLVLGGQTDWEPMLVRMGTDGAVVWARSFPAYGYNSEPQTHVEVAQDGTFLFASSVFGDAKFRTLLGQLQPNGDLVWAGEVEGLIVRDTELDSAGRWLLAGTRVGSGFSGQDAVLVEVDSTTGDVVRALASGVHAMDGFGTLSCTPSGLLVTGVAQVGFGWGEGGARLMSLDAAWGGIACTGTNVSFDTSPVTPAFEPFAFTTGEVTVARTTSPDPLSDTSVALLPGCYGNLGEADCSPAELNSSGEAARMVVTGTDSVLGNHVKLTARKMPPDQPGYFLVGQGSDVLQPPGASGDLCLGGASLGRFVADLQTSGSNGIFHLIIDLNSLPGLGPVAPGETWGFQAWFRDVGATSNFTDAVRVTFR